MAAPTPLVTCFYTTVKNVSTKDRVFGFLGPHGKLLTAGTEYTEWGDLVSKVQSGGIQNKSRKRLALERALKGFTSAAGVVYAAMLHIKASPAIVIYDSGAAVPKTLTLTSGTLGVADPCYGSGY